MTISVLLVDDNPAILVGLRSMLDAEADMTVVGEAANGIAALDLARSLAPDVVVMDVVMPTLDGIRATAHMRELERPPEVVALSADSEHTNLGAMLAAGARGYVTKAESDAELATAIRAVAAGQPHLSREVTSHMLQHCLDAPQTELPPEEPQLSTREELVLRLVADAYPPDAIARKLDIKVATVKKYRAKGMEKLGAKTSADLVLYAYRRGWLGGDR